MIINIKPLSVNDAWRGRRFKTDNYKAWQRGLLMMLPKNKESLNGNLKIEIVFGFSSHASDIDNPLKTLIDTLQKKYKFNDNQITELNVKKEIVKKGKEFIKYQLTQI